MLDENTIFIGKRAYHNYEYNEPDPVDRSL